MASNELSHWGIKGMRWGVRRFQNKDGSLTKAGQKRQAKQRLENLEKARKARAAKKDYEDAKKAALKSGSASEVLKYKGDLTKQQMDTAIARIRWEQDMKGLSEKEVAVGKTRTEKFFSGLDKATTNANTAAKAWNTIANVYNAFSKNSISLPKIDTNITSGNRKERKAEQKEAEKAEAARKKREEQEAQAETKRKERAEKRAKSESESEEKVYIGEVVGEGRSSKKSSSSTQHRPEPVIIDMDTSVSMVPSTYVDRGRSYVAGLLEAPKDDY